MAKVYTPVFHNKWQIRGCTYIDGFEPEGGEDKFDIVELYDNGTHCFSIGFLEWDEKEFDFDIQPVGTRMLSVDEPELFNKWLLNFIEYEIERRRLEREYW